MSTVPSRTTSGRTSLGRIAVLAPDMAGGGAERAAHKLAEGFAARGYASDLVLVKAKGPRLADVAATVRVVDLDADRVAAGLLPLVRYLRRERPIGLVSILDHTSLTALAAKRIARYDGPLVMVEQNNLSTAAQNGSSRRDRVMPTLARRFFPKADAVVGVSAGVVADLRDAVGLPPERLKVVFNPIVDDELLAKAKAEPPHPWFSDGEPVLVAAGRFRPQKDFPTLLRAAAMVRDRGSRLRVVVLGDGPERPALETLWRELRLEGVVEMPGATDNPYAAFSRASAYVLSSRWEGLPTVLIEALACGAPVIATDCPSGPQEILAGGRYGTLLPVGDVAALADAMERAMRRELAPAPAESWQPYTLDAVTDAYCELLAGLR